eukprot:360939-Chlamydomonas_euryale.AAC.2
MPCVKWRMMVEMTCLPVHTSPLPHTTPPHLCLAGERERRHAVREVAHDGGDDPSARPHEPPTPHHTATPLPC